MKLRIQDNSIRYRITLRELEDLKTYGCVERFCRTPWGGELRYAVRVDSSGESRVDIGASSVTLVLSQADFAVLCDETNEGVYVRREWQGPDGAPQRMIAFVEKDRPATACDKPEYWIYEGHAGGEETRRPIPKKATEGQAP
jgi:hypothetical protein